MGARHALATNAILYSRRTGLLAALVPALVVVLVWQRYPTFNLLIEALSALAVGGALLTYYLRNYINQQAAIISLALCLAVVSCTAWHSHLGILIPLLALISFLFALGDLLSPPVRIGITVMFLGIGAGQIVGAPDQWEDFAGISLLTLTLGALFASERWHRENNQKFHSVQQERAEQTLGVQRTAYDALLDVVARAGINIAHINLHNGIITHYSPAFTQLTGLSLNEDMPDHIADIIANLNREQWMASMQPDWLQGIYNEDIGIRTRSGDVVKYRVNVKALPVEAGPDGEEILEAVVQLQDLSEMHSLKDALENQRVQMESALDLGKLAVMVIRHTRALGMEIKGNLFDQYGLSTRSFVTGGAEQWLRHLIPAHHGLFQTTVKKMLAGELSRIDDLELCFKSASGVMFWLNLTARSVRTTDETGFKIVGLVTDITAQRQQQELIEHAKASAQKSIEITTTLVENLDTEAAEPINALYGTLELIKTTSISPEQTEYLTSAEVSADHIHHLISNIAQLAKLSASDWPVVPQDFTLDTVFHRVLRQLFIRAHAAGIDILTSTEADVPQDVRSDHSQVTQILLKLVEYAVRKSKPGVIAIHCTRTHPEHECVVDEFCEITIDIAFTPQTPLDQATISELLSPNAVEKLSSSPAADAGIVIAGILSRSLDGTISLRDAGDQQAVFAVTLPILVKATEIADKGDLTLDADVNSPETEAEPPKTEDFLDNMHVLVAEDNQLSQHILTRMLGKMGAEVEVVKNGEEAVLAAINAATEGHPFDLVLIDIQMPVMNGNDATRKLRTMHCGKKIPIIGMTANTELSDRNEGMAAGMTEFLVKPITIDNLRDVLVRHKEPTPLAKNKEIDAIHLDLDNAIKRLGGDSDECLEIARAFVNSSPDISEKLSATLTPPVTFRERLGDELHDLKGTVLLLGDNEFADWAEQKIASLPDALPSEGSEIVSEAADRIQKLSHSLNVAIAQLTG